MWVIHALVMLAISRIAAFCASLVTINALHVSQVRRIASHVALTEFQAQHVHVYHIFTMTDQHPLAFDANILVAHAHH